MSFWNDEGNFDYEAHFEAGEREKAEATAEWIGYPGMTDTFHHFGLYGDSVSDEVFTPELLAAMDTWQVLLETAEITEDELDRKRLEREHETIDRTIHHMIDD
ncbi:hypothetical protein [Paenarthrobacter aromaticivorans]|uniref:Uncharacterized protein n=1 Tax=Paenarthrobacter aromaticivorans TaxID=2849150 RepID=A0ABS6IC73_9MICC|nr:hypothetical protein [Paenarthrobacter sp. MMS21-TAE1-1]MBU8869204.1 hypothetical protein [Paenarthrobacter sp. MMS21-TAE1-1]